MRVQFPHRLYSQRLFCCRCQKVTDHDIFAQENYTTYGGLDPHIPVLCCCTRCTALFVAFSNEFCFCRKEHINSDYAKIFGHNRVAPGNWLYFKKSLKPGLVKSVFQGPGKDIMVLDYGSGPEKKVECPKVTIQKEESTDGYRLLPAQSAHTLLGDQVYHTIRDQFGVAVGMVNDGEKDKLAVLLKDKTLLFITLPLQAQNAPNDKLTQAVLGKVKQVFPQDASKVSIEVGQGVVYLKGMVRNLSIKRAMKACINGLPKVRGCVDFTRIQTDSYITDTQIERAVIALLESPNVHLFNYDVKVLFGHVEVSAYCNEKYYSRDLENKVAEISGVLALHCAISVIPADQVENEMLCKELETDLALHSIMQGAVVKVSCVNKKFLLEGHVRSVIQKQAAFLSVVKKAKTASIENRLKLL